MAHDSHTLREGPALGQAEHDPLGVIGRRIGDKYEILHHLGCGGFGEVYEATNVNLTDQRLVVKFFKQIETREKFDKEARILCRLDHPNISRVVDYLPHDCALVIHKIDGKNAEAILWESGPLPADTFLAVARSTSAAVAYAHRQGIAHRDLKPSNILIDKNGHVYLIDFGIAKEKGGTVTRTGRVALTPNFAAPERHAGIQSYDPFLSDIYELGVTLFNLATRSLPYHNPASPALEEWRTNAGRRLSPPLRRVLKRAMHPDPGKRYGSMAAMAADLERIRGVHTRPVQRYALWSSVLAALALLLYAALGWVEGRRDVPTATTQRPVVPIPVPGPPAAGLPAQGALPSGVPAQPAAASAEAPDRVEEPVSPRDATAERKGAAEHPAAQPQPVERIPRVAVALRVSPDDAQARMWVNGRAEPLAGTLSLTPGPHPVEIMHPDFPLLRKTIEVRAGTGGLFHFDLAREFAPADSARLQLAIVPPSDTHLLNLSLNGRAHHFSRFPVLDFGFRSGTWRLATAVSSLNRASERAPAVDSCIYFASHGAAPVTVRADRGELTVASGRGRLLVFWTP